MRILVGSVTNAAPKILEAHLKSLQAHEVPEYVKLDYWYLTDPELSELSMMILADFDVWCSHLQASAGRIIAFSKDQAVQMADIWIPQFNNYAQAVEVKSKDHKGRRFRVRKPAPSWEI